MKIGLIHNLYGAYSHGGAETAVSMMAADYRTAGHQVFIISSRPKKPSEKTDEACSEKVYYLSSEFYNLSRHSLAYRALWQISNLLAVGKARQLRKILKSEKPDLIITHNLMGIGFLTPRVIKKLKIRHEHFLHDIQLIHPSGLMICGQEKKIDACPAKIYQSLTRPLFSSPAKVISPSKWLMEIHKKYGFFNDSEQEIRPFVWPYSSSARKEVRVAAQNFLFVGQVESQKGIFLLISAFKKINNPDLTLTIAIRGGGASLAAAKESAKDDARIIFLGPLSYEETAKIMSKSDCLILPSLCYENSPTVIYGAHAAGLPVIASRLGGIPELMGKGDMLFEPGDETDLQNKIIEISKNK